MVDRVRQILEVGFWDLATSVRGLLNNETNRLSFTLLGLPAFFPLTFPHRLFPTLRNFTPFEHLLQHLMYRLHVHEPNPRLYTLGHILLDVRPIGGRGNDRLNPRPMRCQDLLLQPANRENLANEGNLARHRYNMDNQQQNTRR